MERDRRIAQLEPAAGTVGHELQSRQARRRLELAGARAGNVAHDPIGTVGDQGEQPVAEARHDVRRQGSLDDEVD